MTSSLFRCPVTPFHLRRLVLDKAGVLAVIYALSCLDHALFVNDN